MASSIRDYVVVTKPRIVLLLAFTAFGASITGSRSPIDFAPTLLATLAVTLASSGAEAVAAYIERDIDAKMYRTKHRPVPSGRISPRNALIFGLVLISFSLLVSMLLGLLAFGLLLLGIFDYIVIYCVVSKRRHVANILLGSFAGGAPALIGYTAVTNRIDLTALALAALVILWIPTHIWSLALRYREDYAQAGIPMLPVVVGEITAARIIGLTSLVMIAFSILPFLSGFFHIIYFVTASALGVVMLVLNVRLFMKPNGETAWSVFKFSSPYLLLLFLSMMADTLIF